MIRSTVRKHRFGAAALATLASGGLLVLACETPTPPTAMEDAPVLEEATVVTGLTKAEEGYFLVRKTGDEVEYLRSVSPDQLKLIREDPDTLVAVSGVLIKREGDPSTVRLRVKEGVAGTLTAAGPKPLIYVDGIRMADSDGIEDIAPDDIESIEVIKGAAAEALYGERAAGGVIQITLKR